MPLMPALHLTLLGMRLVMEKLEWSAQARPQVASPRHVASALAKAAQALPLQRARRHALFRAADQLCAAVPPRTLIRRWILRR